MLVREDTSIQRNPAGPGRIFSGRIVATIIPRMATRDATQTLKSTANGTVLLDRFNHVSAACWREATMGTQQRADAQFVQPDQPNQDHSRESNDERKHPLHNFALSDWRFA